MVSQTYYDRVGIGRDVRDQFVWFLCFTGFRGGACGYCRDQPYDGKVASYIYVHIYKLRLFGKDLCFLLQQYGI